MTLRIGSLCTGYGGLDEAVQETVGGTVAWHCQYEPPDKNGREDKNQYAAQILAHHWPEIPNHGDITAVDWTTVEPVDVLTMGFPCQDVSVAGLRAGLLQGNRSGLWRHCARAIAELQPSLVVIENVPGLLSSPADGDVEPCPWCLGGGADEPVLRALGAVLADLAGLGFDAEWTSLDASAVGACHKRRRVFILAWPAHTPGPRLEARRQGRPARDLADAADAQGDGRHERRPEPARLQGRPDVALTGGATAAHAEGLRLQRGGQHGDGGLDLRTAIGQLAADPDSEPRVERRNAAPGEEASGRASAVDCGCHRAPWGRYAPAIHRWEQVMGRAAPAPVDERGRLAPPFVEWMQGLPAGHVTAVPGIPRNAQLKALGNGVVPRQAAAAIRVLLARVQATADESAAA